MRTTVCSLLLLAGLFAGAAHAQSGETHSVHASAVAAGGGERASESFRVHDDVVGQLAVGGAVGAVFGVVGGFATQQVLDFTPPATASVNDGTGIDADRIVGDQLCANWTSADDESGLFGARIGLGSAPGLDDVVGFAAVGDPGAACFPGPLPYCQTYFVSVSARNGSSLFGLPGISDGVELIDPVDTDGDGTGNACDDDDDDDGNPDLLDPCPCDAFDDVDQDGLCDNDPLCGLDTDNCPTIANPGQHDTDGNGIGDACESTCTYFAGNGSPDCATIQECIDLAVAGCRVLIAPGTYQENLVVDKPLTIRAVSTAQETVLQSPGSLPVIQVPSGTAGEVRIERLALSGGSSGLSTASSVRVSEGVISGSFVGIDVIDDGTGARPLVRVEGTSIQNVAIGIRGGAGALLVDRSWVRNANQRGIEVQAGSLDLGSSLVTDCGGEGIHFASSATGAIRFGTISDCDVGIDNESDSLSVTVDSSIVYGNLSAQIQGVACSNVTHTDLAQSCCPVNGNLCVDPQFEAPLLNDYRLSKSSPCTDAGGDPALFPGTPPLDYAGVPRLLDADGDGLARGDLGAYEGDNAPSLIPGEVANLIFNSLGSIRWDLQASSTSYNMYSGMISNLDYGYDLQCLGNTAGTAWFPGATVVPPGDAAYFLVTGETDAGEESTLGFGSSAERSNFNPCP